MRKKIELVPEAAKIENDIVKLSPSYLKDLVKNRGALSVLKEYEIPEEFILENTELFEKGTVIGMMNLSEDFIFDAIEIGYFDISDLKDLSMKTYSNLSKVFLKLYPDHLNWNKIMIYLISSGKIKNMEEYLPIIEKYDLWTTISINGDLTSEFIREHKDKLDWKMLCLTQNFSESDKLEFLDHMVDVRSEPPTEEELILNFKDLI